MDNIVRRVAYGMSAEREHKNAKIKTEPSKYDRMDEQRQDEENRRLY